MHIIKFIILLIIFFSLYSSFETCEHFTNTFPIYVINLERRSDRKQKFIKKLKEFNVDAKFFTAVDGSNIDIQNLLNSNKLNYTDRYIRTGEVGCYFSHINLWQKILNDNNDDNHYTLIMEDDANITKDFITKSNIILNEIKDIDWDILYLGRSCDRFFGSKCNGKELTKNTIIPNTIGYGLHSYIIKNKAIKKLLVNILPIVYPIDHYILLAVQNNIINVVALKKDIIYVEDSKSDTINEK